MDPENIAALADRELALVRSGIPSDSGGRFLLLLEIQRYFDTCFASQDAERPAVSSQQDLDVMKWGMNLATSELLRPLTVEGAIPFAKTSSGFRRAAAFLLYKFGIISLLRRAAEMVRVGMLESIKTGDTWIFRETGRFIHQFMDQMEPVRWGRYIENRKSMEIDRDGWTLVDYEDADSIARRLGAFSTRPSKSPSNLLSAAELEEIMLPLMRPWSTPYGTFLAYDADERVDNNFFAVAGERISHSMEEAGIHPSVDLSGFSAPELLAVCVVLSMFYTKHLAHCLIAAKQMPEIDAPSCLTLWQKKNELVGELSDATGLDENKIELIISYLAIRPDDVERLANEPVAMLPILIDLGNGMLLRPVSSMSQNALINFISISKWRDSQAINRISKAREPWFRTNLYAIFRGNRYVCVDGNVIVRRNGRRLTDIDAAILDTVTGQLALFQLKWQDYFSNSARQLGSRAKNFSVDVDSWADALHQWIEKESVLSVAQSLRLDISSGHIPKEIYMFALSWKVARSAGYGFPVRSSFISVASWSQFCRVRSEVGPANEVFGRIHEALREEEATSTQILDPLPYEIKLSGGEELIFEDLWSLPRVREEGGG